MTTERDISNTAIENFFINDDLTSQKILIACSWLAQNEPLPLDLLLVVSGENQEKFTASLDVLVSAGFLIHSEENLIIQAEASKVIKDTVSSDRSKLILAETGEALYNLTKNLETAGEFEPYATHIEVLAQHEQVNKVANAGMLLGLLGRYKLQIEKYKDAVNFLRRALLIIENTKGVESVEHTENLNNLGSALHRLGKYEQAKKCFAQAIIVDREILGEDHPAVAVGHNNLGLVSIDMNNLEAAIIHLEKALEINKEHFGNDHHLVASGHYNLGLALLAIGDLPRARAQLELALQKRKNIYGDIHVIVAEAHHGLGLILQAIGNATEAKEHYRKAIRIFESISEGSRVKLAASYVNYGGILHVEDQIDAARENYKKALDIFKAELSADDKNIRDVSLQLQLIDIGITMPDLLIKLENGEQLPDELMSILDKSFNLKN